MGGINRLLGWRSVAAGWMLLAVSAVPISGAQAQTTTPTAPAPSTSPAPATPPNTPPAATSPTIAAPSASSPNAAPAPAVDTTGASPGDASISQTLDVPPRPAVVLSGTATWDDGFKTLQGAFAKLNDALSKNNMTSNGRPLAVFTSTDDKGFNYSVMLPIAQAPEGKTELTPEVKVSETPSGKAIRFQHRAAYDDIDSTYEAITAYLDEKGLEARNLFAEEYLNQVKTADDPSLEVDIYVFLK
jgi:effector-binding domain-containing protein